MIRRTSAGFRSGRSLGPLAPPLFPTRRRPECDPRTHHLGPLAGRLPGESPMNALLCVPSLPPRRSGGAVWTPRNLASLLRWYTASAITGVSNGDPVALWPDSSPAGVDAVQVATSRKPTFHASAVNSRPGVYFDGVDDQIAFPLTSLGTAHTMFLVFERFTTAARTHVGGQIAANYFMVYLDATDWGYYAGDTGTPGNAWVPHGGIPTSQWTILALRRTGSAVEFFKNNAQLSTTQTLPNNIAMEVSTIGAREGGVFNADTTIADLIFCDQALSDDDMALTWNYLNNLYAVY